MPATKQRVDKTQLDSVMKFKGITQADLANKIGADPKSFSRWINDGFVYSNYILGIMDVLDLSEDESKRVLRTPSFTAVFRKKYLSTVNDQISERAIDIAKTYFRLNFLHEGVTFCPPDLSSLDDVNEIADQIRKYTGIENFDSIGSMILNLSKQGIEIAVIPFSWFGLQEYKNAAKETAFSVSDGKRWTIFLDSNEPEESLIFNLCHELCHIFRPNIEADTSEERLCQAVAAELVYPARYFEKRRDKIEQICESNSIEAIRGLILTIQQDIGGSPFGIIIRMRSLKLLSQKNNLHKKVFGYFKKADEALPKIEASIFSDFLAGDQERFRKFWSRSDLDSNILLRFFSMIKRAAEEETLSPRRFAELFLIDVGDADELIHSWRLDIRNRFSDCSNG